MTFLWILSIAIACIWLFPLALMARRSLHILQLEEYDNARLLRWAGARRFDAAGPWIVLALGIAILLIASAFASFKILAVLLLVLWLVPAVLLAATARPQAAKKPLVYTARMRRLIASVVLVELALAAVIAALVFGILHAHSLFAAAVLTPTLPVVVLLLGDSHLVAAGNIAARPAEKTVQRRYLRDAHRRIRRLHPTIIGITGSFGKTTTKELLASILASRFRTVKTPESWNTPMGITRAIRERLTEQHEIFVVEMGCYVPGDIATLCRLTGPPRIGIITGVNEQHLERMGSIENTMKTKYELIEALEPGGLAIFNADNEYCRRLADYTQNLRVVRIGLNPENGPLDYTASEIVFSPQGTRFTLIAGEQQAPFRTRLLGEHFVINVLAATAAAVECGMTLQQIAAAVAAAPPVPHRLQLLPSPEGITTIDDAYSANPDGARAALQVLARMHDGKRILVTPGFVELGSKEEAFNRQLGELARSACDLLVLVGPRRTTPIREGALAAGMEPSRIEVVRDIAGARAYLASVAAPGDTILFENDLPDNYNET